MSDVHMLTWFCVDRAWWVVGSVVLHSPDKGFCVLFPDMPKRPEASIFKSGSAILGSDSPQFNNSWQ